MSDKSQSSDFGYFFDDADNECNAKETVEDNRITIDLDYNSSSVKRLANITLDHPKALTPTNIEQ